MNSVKKRQKRQRTIYSYEPGRFLPLINAALRGKHRGSIKALLDECVIGQLGPKYPKVMLKTEVERPASEVANGKA